MINSYDINSHVQKNILNGAKTPHSTSYPVIYSENEKYYLAVFVFFYSREDIEAGEVERPTMWAIADIETGEIIEERLTKDKDFSDASYDMKYSVHGKAAEWDAGGVHMEGGAGQMNTVYSWGTCRDAGIISKCGKAKID